MIWLCPLLFCLFLRVALGENSDGLPVVVEPRKCRKPNDCDPGTVCLVGFCRVMGAKSEDSCSSHDDCPTDRFCEDERCHPFRLKECEEEQLDCPDDQICVGGVCLPEEVANRIGSAMHDDDSKKVPEDNAEEAPHPQPVAIPRQQGSQRFQPLNQGQQKPSFSPGPAAPVSHDPPQNVVPPQPMNIPSAPQRVPRPIAAPVQQTPLAQNTPNVPNQRQNIVADLAKEPKLPESIAKPERVEQQSDDSVAAQQNAPPNDHQNPKAERVMAEQQLHPQEQESQKENDPPQLHSDRVMEAPQQEHNQVAVAPKPGQGNRNENSAPQPQAERVEAPQQEKGPAPMAPQQADPSGLQESPDENAPVQAERVEAPRLEKKPAPQPYPYPEMVQEQLKMPLANRVTGQDQKVGNGNAPESYPSANRVLSSPPDGQNFEQGGQGPVPDKVAMEQHQMRQKAEDPHQPREMHAQERARDEKGDPNGQNPMEQNEPKTFPERTIDAQNYLQEPPREKMVSNDNDPSELVKENPKSEAMRSENNPIPERLSGRAEDPRLSLEINMDQLKDVLIPERTVLSNPNSQPGLAPERIEAKSSDQNDPAPNPIMPSIKEMLETEAKNP